MIQSIRQETRQMDTLSEIISVTRGNAFLCHLMMSLEHSNLLSGVVLLTSDDGLSIATRESQYAGGKVLNGKINRDRYPQLRDLFRYLSDNNIEFVIYYSDILRTIDTIFIPLVKPNKEWRYKITQDIRRVLPELFMFNGEVTNVLYEDKLFRVSKEFYSKYPLIFMFISIDLYYRCMSGHTMNLTFDESRIHHSLMILACLSIVEECMFGYCRTIERSIKINGDSSIHTSYEDSIYSHITADDMYEARIKDACNNQSFDLPLIPRDIDDGISELNESVDGSLSDRGSCYSSDGESLILSPQSQSIMDSKDVEPISNISSSQAHATDLSIKYNIEQSIVNNANKSHEVTLEDMFKAIMGKHINTFDDDFESAYMDHYFLCIRRANGRLINTALFDAANDIRQLITTYRNILHNSNIYLRLDMVKWYELMSKSASPKSKDITIGVFFK